MKQCILKINDVKKVTGKSRSAIYESIARGAFPRPVKIGARASGWVASEVEAWVQARVADRDGSLPK